MGAGIGSQVEIKILVTSVVKGRFQVYDGAFPTQNNLIFDSTSNINSVSSVSTRGRVIIQGNISDGIFEINLEENCDQRIHLQQNQTKVILNPFYPHNIRTKNFSRCKWNISADMGHN